MSALPCALNRSVNERDAITRSGSVTVYARSFPCLAATETLHRQQDLTGLTPKGGFVAAQPVEGIGRQIRQADEGLREIVVRSRGRRDRRGTVFGVGGELVSISTRGDISVRAVDDLLALLRASSQLSEPKQLFRLDLEQAAFNRSGPAEPPQQACQPE